MEGRRPPLTPRLAAGRGRTPPTRVLPLVAVLELLLVLVLVPAPVLLLVLVLEPQAGLHGAQPAQQPLWGHRVRSHWIGVCRRR